MNMKRKQAVVINAPRLEGDSIPSIATTAEGKKGQRTAALMYVCQAASGERARPACNHSRLGSLPSAQTSFPSKHNTSTASSAGQREEATALISSYRPCFSLSFPREVSRCRSEGKAHACECLGPQSPRAPILITGNINTERCLQLGNAIQKLRNTGHRQREAASRDLTQAKVSRG